MDPQQLEDKRWLRSEEQRLVAILAGPIWEVL